MPAHVPLVYTGIPRRLSYDRHIHPRDPAASSRKAEASGSATPYARCTVSGPNPQAG